MNDAFDLVVVGAGPGGYVGAIRAAQLGLKTAVVEKGPTFGGTCLNVGCIPSKALLESSEHYLAAKHDLAEHGVRVGAPELDLKQMMARKNKIVDDLTKGIRGLFDKNKITAFRGHGRLLDGNTLEVRGEGSPMLLKAKNILLATGSVSNTLPTLPFDGHRVISSTEALSLEKVPKHLIVVGAGAIGLELGSVWLRLGAKVTVVEFADRIGGQMDLGICKRALQIFKKQGMEFLLNTEVKGSNLGKSTVVLKCESRSDKSLMEVEGDVALVAAGRKPFSEGLGLEELGIKKDARGYVLVDGHFRTQIPSVFAVGDLIPGPMLAHKAEEEGVAVAEILSGQAGHVNYPTVPSVIYTWPEIASVGLSEEQLKEKGIAYKSGTFPFSANGRAKALGHTEGQVKILADSTTDKVLGCHILGPRASDLLAEAVTLMEFGGSAEDMARTFHAHPTLSEVLREAALNVEKRARQM